VLLANRNPKLEITAMPTASDFFPSNYLRCADLKGKERIATIAYVTTEDFENDGKKQSKPVVYFREKETKPLVCNKTNFLSIAKFCGDNTDEWPDKKILLTPTMVSFKNQVTEAHRRQCR
jgi:hypothetical protein